MARRSVQDCVNAIINTTKDGELTKAQADELLNRIDNMASKRAKKLNGNYEEALKQIEGELLGENLVASKIDKRNRLLTIKAKRRIKSFVGRFESIGEGLQAILEGSNKKIKGARKSVDYQAKALNQQYFGRAVAEMEQSGVWEDFKKGKHAEDIYRELAELSSTDGSPGKTGNTQAQKIANTIYGVRKEMVSRQNSQGSYIRELDGFITRQTHDSSEIRKLGGETRDKQSKNKSFTAWKEFILPLLNEEATFKGINPDTFLRKVHEGLYTGVHGAPSAEAELDLFSVHGSLAKKASAERVLHFKDADSTFKYNERFGSQHIRDSFVQDVYYRARSIALMENFGPNPKNTFDQIKRELAEEARESDDAAKQVDSLKSWKIDASWAEVSGENAIASDITLHKVSSNIRIIAQMSKMGGVMLSSLGDKAFLHSEMAWQGMRSMDIMAKQISGMASRGEEGKRALRLMGAGLDGMLGNVANRYTVHSSVSGFAHRAQQKFFDMNFMNWWNDTHKSSAVELMAAHLGEYSSKTFAKIPEDLKNVLSLYDIGPGEWNVIRQASSKADNGGLYITPDQVKNVDVELIKALLVKEDVKPTSSNISRKYNELETQLRTYLADRTDFAVPTPGGGERKFTNFGTQAGTPLGEALRMTAMFKSFPITVFRKIIGREVYGNGSKNIKDFLANGRKGQMRIAQLVALTTIGGYLSGAIKDTLKGRTPKPLIKPDGSINEKALTDAALRGGGLGIMGDFLFSEYDRRYNSFSGQLAGPIVGQLDPLAASITKLRKGEDASKDLKNLTLGNTPYLNLFYMRPVLDYYVLWNMQEMMSPGSIDRMATSVEDKNFQEFLIDPREAIAE